MPSLNKAMIIGRLGKDPELKYSQNGSAYCNFSVATSETWKDKQSGEKKESTEWHNVVMFGRIAEVAGEYLHKGSLAYFEGPLQTDSYEKDGVKRYSTKLRCFKMEMLDSKDDGGNESAPGAGPHDQSQANDDIPF